MELLKNESEEEPNNPSRICGEMHNCNDCSVVKLHVHINDTPVLSRARLSLPSNLIIEKMSEGSFMVSAKYVIEEGTRFGPFDAKKVFSLEQELHFPLKVFCNSDYIKEYYLDNSNEFGCNWMYFVQPASTFEEQNLICYEDKCNIFYMSIRKILIGEHLKVWYGSYYASKMDKDVLKPVQVVENLYDECNVDVKELVKTQSANNKFTKNVDGKSDDLGGPLLNEVLSDTLENTNVLLEHMILPNFDKNRTNVMLESENLHLGVGSLLNENVHFKFEEKGQHLGCHTGKFTCNNCLKVFCSIKNLNRHKKSHNAKIRNMKVYKYKEMDMKINNNSESHTCSECGQKFPLKKYLYAHMNVHNYKYNCTELQFNSMHKNVCQICKEVFQKAKELKQHKVVHYEKFYECPVCKNILKLRSSLRRHLKNKHYDIDIDPKTISVIQRKTCNENIENVDTNNINVDSNCNDTTKLPNLQEKDDTDPMQDINLDYIVKNYDLNQLEDLIDLNTLEMDFEQNFNIQEDVNVSSQEVCLSIPELTDLDKKITLGDAYIIGNGKIIEPINEGKVILFMLDNDQKG